MSLLSKNNRQSIEKLKDWYKTLPKKAKRLFPSKVSAAIFHYESGSENESVQALELCRVFIREAAAITRWSFPFSEVGLEVFSMSSLMSDAYELNRAGLLAGDVALVNFDAVAGEQGPRRVAEAFRLLNDKILLIGDAAQANFDAVVRHRDPFQVAQALKAIGRAGLLAGDIAPANFDAVAEHEDSRGVAEALGGLHRAGLLTRDVAQANFDAVIANEDPRGVAEALGVLQRAGLLTGDAAQENRDAVAEQEGPRRVVEALGALHSAGLLTGDTAQDNFDALILHSAILLHDEITVFWSRIPTHRFTLARFAALMEICRQHTDNSAAGRDLVIAYINGEMLGMNDLAAAEAPRLNAEQSTHTASVHRSVSESAARLMARYGSKILGRQLDIMIREISMWCNAQPDSPLKVKKAKRCLQRLTAPEYCFTDSSSQVSLKQLLALFWIAIHDDTRRTGTLDDAKLQLIEGLYETQREHNISATGMDDGCGDDIPSCPSGTFNKMIEKGQGLHPDMVIDFISMAGFSLKFQRVVMEEAMVYLRSRAYSNLGSLTEAIKADGNANSVGPIWAEIQAVVAERMFEEFGSLFRNDRMNPRFVSDIATGEFLALNPGNLRELDKLVGQVSQDGGAPAAGAAPDGFFAAATPRAKDETDIAAKRHRP
jgi:hypothetical protein